MGSFLTVIWEDKVSHWLCWPPVQGAACLYLPSMGIGNMYHKFQPRPFIVSAVFPVLIYLFLKLYVFFKDTVLPRLALSLRPSCICLLRARITSQCQLQHSHLKTDSRQQVSYCVLFRSPGLPVSQHLLPSHVHIFLSFECLRPLLKFMLICVGSFVLPSPVLDVGLTGFLLLALALPCFPLDEQQ